MVVSRRRAEQELVHIRGSDEERNSTVEEVQNEEVVAIPNHLVIMVNGIAGRASNWIFAAEQFKQRLGDQVLIHRSACNSSFMTFHGVDVMGQRLADEIRECIKTTSGLSKISFLSHSLGGLVARYAIAKLYVPPIQDHETESTSKGTLAGLEAGNFITIATPHLGSRGSKQLPFLCGFRCLEKTAICIAHWFVGRTGRHLFLSDGSHNQMPLLRRMVTDCEEGMFMSALKIFKRRVVYANVNYDHMVGWRTSSLRRESELPKIKHRPIDPKYPHIVYTDKISTEAADDDNDVKSSVAAKDCPASDPIEEEMLCALTQLTWERVDVSFHGSIQRFIAHSTIQVKTYEMHSDGADVILHVIDHFLC